MSKIPRQTFAAILALLLTAAAFAALPANDRSPARAFAELQGLPYGQ